MRWSQLKKRMEETFADAVRGRLEVWVTRYRHAHDEVGEAWITVDKQKIVTMGELRFLRAHYQTVRRLRDERDCLDYRDPTRWARYDGAWDEATTTLQDAGIFDSRDLPRSMFTYLNLSIDDALNSEELMLRAFCVLDRRFGKRRLFAFDPTNEHQLVRQFYHFRCHAEKLRFGQPLGVTAAQGAIVAAASCHKACD